MAMSQGPRQSREPKATCAGPLCEDPSPCRGLRPHHARRECVGTWETSSGPQSHERSRAATGSRRRSCRGTGEESDGSIVLEKPSNKAVRSGGGEGGRKGPSRRKRSMLKHAPDTAPASACHKRRRSADRTETGRPSPERRSRSTSDKSPVRASRTPGSEGEVPGNRHLYPTLLRYPQSGTAVTASEVYDRIIRANAERSQDVPQCC